MWIVYLEESGEEKEFRTKKEALKWIAQVKDFDKRHGITDEVYTLVKED